MKIYKAKTSRGVYMVECKYHLTTLDKRLIKTSIENDFKDCYTKQKSIQRVNLNMFRIHCNIEKNFTTIFIPNAPKISNGEN